ncbi:ABC transporter substrate-binding protein [Metaplanococcus flavidus]|uniref:ABC transporter substrate-binding protein n=1 Tax=Metaplanococcus flavidus TaxID=569883 RepID=A0ABW3LDL2_9BACL
MIYRNKRLNSIFIGALFGISIILSGCGSESGEAKEENAQIDLMLDWYPNAVHSYLYVAEEKGFFEEQGLDVNLHFPTNPTDPINMVASGQMTLGITYQPDVITARANQGINIKSVAAIVRSPLNHVVMLENSEMESPADLEGMKVGYPGIPLNEALIKTMVSEAGGNPEEVEMIDVGFELGSSLVSKKVDAVVGAYINHEVPLLASKGVETKTLNPEKYGVPPYYELVLVTNDENWEGKEEEIRAFWKAASKGYEWMAEHPTEAVELLLKNQDEANFPLAKEVEDESMAILLPRMKADEGFGSQSKEDWKNVADWMLERELIEELPDLDLIFENLLEEES